MPDTAERPRLVVESEVPLTRGTAGSVRFGNWVVEERAFPVSGDLIIRRLRGDLAREYSIEVASFERDPATELLSLIRTVAEQEQLDRAWQALVMPARVDDDGDEKEEPRYHFFD